MFTLQLTEFRGCFLCFCCNLVRKFFLLTSKHRQAKFCLFLIFCWYSNYVFCETTLWLWTLMTRNSTAVMPMDIHKQAIKKKKMSASWIRKTSHKNKGNEKRLETLFTHRRSNIKFLIFTQTSFYCGFDRYKVMDCFFGSASELSTSVISLMQNLVQTFLLTFQRKVSFKPCESMQISWRVVNCYYILNLHSSGISRENLTLSRFYYFIE